MREWSRPELEAKIVQHAMNIIHFRSYKSSKNCIVDTSNIRYILIISIILLAINRAIDRLM